jgi:hypothetical protein
MAFAVVATSYSMADPDEGFLPRGSLVNQKI